MTIKYKNNKGSNERKSNQGNMKSHNQDIKEQLKEKSFGKYDQEEIEEAAGKRGQTSGDSFDKIMPKNRSQKKK